MPLPNRSQHDVDDDYADIEAQHPPPPPEVSDAANAPEGVFRVCDEGSANWVIRKIVAARSHATRARDWAQQEVRRAEREEAFFLWRFGRDLEAWVLRQLRQSGASGGNASGGGRRKSVNLPAGTVGYRRQGPRLTIDDERAALAWARTHCPQAVQTQERLTKTPLEEHLAATGELPPGTHVEPGGERFYVK